MNKEIYYQRNTSNKSFIDVNNYLEKAGIKNNSFFLMVYDKRVINLDPYSNNLSEEEKDIIIKECKKNYWYFIREVVRIPQIGTSETEKYILHRGNLAINYCIELGLNTFIELPRSLSRNLSICIRLLWEFIFGVNSDSLLISNSNSDARLKIECIKNIYYTLPEYLRLQEFDKNKTTIRSEFNNIRINKKPKTIFEARNLGRMSTSRQWYIDFPYIQFNNEMLYSSLPVFMITNMNCKKNNIPSGIIITATGGDLKNKTVKESYNVKNNSILFDESWYDRLNETILENCKGSFVNIKFMYDQLGKDSIWANEMYSMFAKDMKAFRKEVLLEYIHD